jgi:multicomponent K+:H+ antiporter subunit D
MERGRSPGDDVLAVTLEAYGDDDDESEQTPEVGAATPGTFAALGVAFVCCAILVAGMPPLSGFLGKFLMIGAMLETGDGVAAGVWATIAILIVSGLAATIALMRSGINTFWVSLERVIPAIHSVEIAPIVLFLVLALGMTIYAQPVMHFMETAADMLYADSGYVDAVLADRTTGAGR